uniref:Uncharacterized protein n=1 Tax=Panagrolaimus davidi TaxID=227884 RepID=A0A914QST9_9BILA
MDSSDPQLIISSNRKRKAQDSTMVNCKRTKFMKTYQRQNFSMPDSIIFYIAKNPKTAELYLKMVKTCKYFFVKNPIIILPTLKADDGKWRVNEKPLDFTKYNCKYWITGEIYASAYESVDENILSPIIPKIYRCDVKRLYLYSQVMSFDDLSLIVSSAEKIYLKNVIVKHSDSSDIPLEDIVAIAVKAKEIYVTKPTITSKTMKELLQIPHFATLDQFVKNQHTKFFLYFDDSISDAYKNRLELFIDEILETKEIDYIPPFICCPERDREKSQKLSQKLFPFFLKSFFIV